MNVPSYFDDNDTTPVDLKMADAIEPYLQEYFSNPSLSRTYKCSAGAVRWCTP
jgi:cysteine sulfinate desulfinase/cysteine desulfurase-like protein